MANEARSQRPPPPTGDLAYERVVKEKAELQEQYDTVAELRQDHTARIRGGQKAGLKIQEQAKEIAALAAQLHQAEEKAAAAKRKADLTRKFWDAGHPPSPDSPQK